MTRTPERSSGPDRSSGFELALLELLPLLHLWARRRASSPDAANDLLQDTLVRALQARDGFSDGSNLRAWLFMIMRNLAVDRGRRQARRGPHLPIDEAALPVPVGPTQDSVLGLRDLSRAFARLPQDQQELLLRIAAGGESYLELAATYGIALGTVKSRVARARTRLRDELWSGVPGGED